MPDSTVEEKSSASPRDQWRERIAEQARSGVSIKEFCKDRGIAEHVVLDDAVRQSLVAMTTDFRKLWDDPALVPLASQPVPVAFGWNGCVMRTRRIPALE